jgi:hypothetical protein
MGESFSRTYFSNIDSSLSEENLNWVVEAKNEALSKVNVRDCFDGSSFDNADIVFKFYHNSSDPLFGLVGPDGDFYIYDGINYVPFDPETDVSKFFSFETAFKSLQDRVNSSLHNQANLSPQEMERLKELPPEDAIFYLNLVSLKSNLDKSSKAFISKKKEFLKNKEFNEEYTRNCNNSEILFNKANDRFLANVGIQVSNPEQLQGSRLNLAYSNFDNLHKVEDVNSDVPFVFEHNGESFYGHVIKRGDSADFYVSDNPDDKGVLLDPSKNLELFNSFQNGFRDLLTYEKNSFNINDEVPSYNYIVKHCNIEISNANKKIAGFDKQIKNIQRLISTTGDVGTIGNYERQIRDIDIRKKDIIDSELYLATRRRDDSQARLDFLGKYSEKEEYKRKKLHILTSIENNFQNKLNELLVFPLEYQPYNSSDLTISSVDQVQPSFSSGQSVIDQVQPDSFEAVQPIIPSLQSTHTLIKPAQQSTPYSNLSQSQIDELYAKSVIDELKEVNEHYEDYEKKVALHHEEQSQPSQTELFPSVDPVQPSVSSDQPDHAPKPQQSTPYSNLSQSQIDKLYAKSVIDELKEVNEHYEDYEKKVALHHEEQSQQSKPVKSTLDQNIEQDFESIEYKVNEISQMIAPPISEAEKQEFEQELRGLVDDGESENDDSLDDEITSLAVDDQVQPQVSSTKPIAQNQPVTLKEFKKRLIEKAEYNRSMLEESVKEIERLTLLHDKYIDDKDYVDDINILLLVEREKVQYFTGNCVTSNKLKEQVIKVTNIKGEDASLTNRLLSLIEKRANVMRRASSRLFATKLPQFGRNVVVTPKQSTQAETFQPSVPFTPKSLRWQVDVALKEVTDTKLRAEQLGQVEAKGVEIESSQKFKEMSLKELRKEVKNLQNKQKEQIKSLKSLEKRINKYKGSKIKNSELLKVLTDVNVITSDLSDIPAEKVVNDAKITWASHILKDKEAVENAGKGRIRRFFGI